MAFEKGPKFEKKEKKELFLIDKNLYYTKFFNEEDVAKTIEAIEETKPKTILFIDTPATPHLIALIKGLKEKGYDIIVRDHHDVENPQNPREEQIHNAVEELKLLLDARSTFSTREKDPACSSLVKEGEFANEDEDIIENLIIADPDPDGLLASIKAMGITYEGLEEDANVLDGPRSKRSKENLSEYGWLLSQAMGTVAPQDLKGKKAVFENFIKMVKGDKSAKKFLEDKIKEYEKVIEYTEKLAEQAEPLSYHIIYLDTTNADRFDLGHLLKTLEKKFPEMKVNVFKKAFGPIAKKFGSQYSLSVIQKYNKDINLQELVQDEESSLDNGVISNTTFLLHLSPEKFEEYKDKLIHMIG